MDSDYGTYRLTYTPPNDPNAYYPLITIDMSTPGDANVEQMLRFYEAFLAASGFILKGDLQVVEPESDPWGHMTVRGSQAADFVPFGLSDDVISFGSFGTPPWDANPPSK